MNKYEKKASELILELIELRAALKQAQARIEQLEDGLQQVVNWSKAYPLKVFPEPNWREVGRMLGAKILSQVSVSNMRHVVEGVGKIAAEALGTAGESNPLMDVILEDLEENDVDPSDVFETVPEERCPHFWHSGEMSATACPQCHEKWKT